MWSGIAEGSLSDWTAAGYYSVGVKSVLNFTSDHYPLESAYVTQLKNGYFEGDYLREVTFKVDELELLDTFPKWRDLLPEGKKTLPLGKLTQALDNYKGGRAALASGSYWIRLIEEYDEVEEAP
jgi:hypothetical protein